MSNTPKPSRPDSGKTPRSESRIVRRIRALRVNRAVFLSAIVILLTLAVILIVTAVTNRARRNAIQDVLKPVTGSDLTDEPQPSPPPVTDNKPDTPEPPAPETVPTLSLPVEGALLRAHSSDLQVFSPTMQDYRVHLGIDLTTTAGAPVLAAADGVVSRVWDDPLMGKCVAIAHAADSLTVYKNLANDLPTDITEGARVVRGQRLGTVGDTAMLEVAEEPHLHMEMTVGGLQVNPLEYFPASVSESLSKDLSYEDEGDVK